MSNWVAAGVVGGRFGGLVAVGFGLPSSHAAE